MRLKNLNWDENTLIATLPAEGIDSMQYDYKTKKKEAVPATDFRRTLNGPIKERIKTLVPEDFPESILEEEVLITREQRDLSVSPTLNPRKEITEDCSWLIAERRGQIGSRDTLPNNISYYLKA